MVKVTLYTREGCWLCDQAEEMLNGLMQRYALSVRKVDIGDDDELYERFRFDIPVIAFEDGAMFKGRVRKSDLLRYLDAHQE